MATYQPGRNYYGEDNPSYKATNAADAFTNYLGRPLTGANPWATDPNAGQNIYNSEEAFNYRNKAATGGGGARPSAQDFIAQYQQSNPASGGIVPLYNALQNAGYTDVSRYMYGSTPSNNELNLNGQKWKVLSGEDSPNPSWYIPGTNDMGGGGNAFSDPATAGWESLLRQVSGQLASPTQTPDYQSVVDYLKSYAQQLQGPAYTPQQSELIQTQALDPLTQQRDAQKQQVLQWAAAHGMKPTDGPVLEQMQAIDRGYQGARTQVQSGFAANAIGTEKSQQAQAAQVLQTLQGLESGQQTGNENRALQAVSLMGMIPQLADSRLAAANNTLAGTNAAIAPFLSFILGSQGQANQQNQFNAQQNEAYWQWIGALLGNIF